MHAARVAYRTAGRAATTPRECELLALGVVNRALGGAATSRERVEALGRSHALWTVLVRDLSSEDNGLPAELKVALIALGGWAMQYSTQALLHDLPLQPLIEVNQNLADGLRAQPGG